jgi:hypothetical protein
MNKFVLIGHIEFVDGTAYVRKVLYGARLNDLAIEGLDELRVDYILPHYYKGRIVFDQFHDEDWHTSRDLLIEKLDREEMEEKIQARRDADY